MKLSYLRVLKHKTLRGAAGQSCAVQGSLVACERHKSPLHALKTPALVNPGAALVNVCTEGPSHSNGDNAWLNSVATP